MKRKYLVLLGTKLLGAYFIIFGLINLPFRAIQSYELDRYFRMQGGVAVSTPWIWMSHFGHGILQVLLGLLFWYLAGKLAVLSQVELRPTIGHLSPIKSYLATGVIVIGVILLAGGVPALGGDLFGASARPGDSVLWTTPYGNITAQILLLDILRIGLGAWLLLDWKRITRLLQQRRLH